MGQQGEKDEAVAVEARRLMTYMVQHMADSGLS